MQGRKKEKRGSGAQFPQTVPQVEITCFTLLADTSLVSSGHPTD